MSVTAAGATPATATDDSPAGPTPGPAGVVVDMPDEEYHRRKDSLSASGAKLLLPPSCPAIFKWQRDNPPPSKPHFDFGHAAHKSVLGVGQPVRYIDAKDWRTKRAQQEQAEAYAAGEIPLLEEQRGIIEGMTAALRAHPLAARLLDPTEGQPEISLFATDPETGVNLRSRLDWLPNPRNGRLLLCDYKTTVSANPTVFVKSAANLNYHMQDSFYRAIVRLLGLDDDPAFLFIAQEKTPPFIVSVIDLEVPDKAIGEYLNRQAIDLYSECMAADRWPTYGDDVAQVPFPYWYRKQFEMDNSW